MLLGVHSSFFLNIIKSAPSKWLSRNVSALTHEKHKISPMKSEKNAPRFVYVSMVNDIYTNLALEHWLYQKARFENQRILLLWWNRPCVVIGRHQNPWTEVNMSIMKEKDIALARRNSGGGTVYHDSGNLNLSFFAPRDLYNRKENLETICSALRKSWNLDVEVTKRDDIALDNFYKISGTASKLGGSTSYHHCTLLVNVNTKNLTEVLCPDQIGITSKATASVPSFTRNLTEHVPDLKVEDVAQMVGEEYLTRSLASCNRGFHLVNPTESWFPGLSSIRSEFTSREWIYDKTPKFTISKTIPVPLVFQSELGNQLNVSLSIEHGKIVELSPPFSELNLSGKKISEVANFKMESSTAVQIFLAETLKTAIIKLKVL